MPMPSPPGGIRWVLPSRGRKVILSKASASSGYFSTCQRTMLVISAMPGTKSWTYHCFSCWGFSQLYSTMPFSAASVSSSTTRSSDLPVSLAISAVVLGLRRPILSMISAISSLEHARSRMMYSGSVSVSLFRPSL